MQRADLTMPIVIREPRYSSKFTRTTVYLCYACGLLYLEAQDHPIEGSRNE